MVNSQLALKRARTCSNLHLDAINMASTKAIELVFNLLPVGIDAVDREDTQMFPRCDIGAMVSLSASEPAALAGAGALWWG